MTDSDDRETTPEKRAHFLALLSMYGNVSKSAEEAKLNRTALYDYRIDHPEFAAEWERAAIIGAKALEDEARRRAFEGTISTPQITLTPKISPALYLKYLPAPWPLSCATCTKFKPVAA